MNLQRPSLQICEFSKFQGVLLSSLIEEYNLVSFNSSYISWYSTCFVLMLQLRLINHNLFHRPFNYMDIYYLMQQLFVHCWKLLYCKIEKGWKYTCGKYIVRVYSCLQINISIKHNLNMLKSLQRINTYHLTVLLMIWVIASTTYHIDFKLSTLVYILAATIMICVI